MAKAIVISAYPATGKSHFTKKYGDKLNVLDSDSSLYSWIHKTNGERVRNPDFLNSYIEHIKENLDKADIIFVSSHLEVRRALQDEKIPYVTVYPCYNQKDAFIIRMKNRGNTEQFVEDQEKNWDARVASVVDEPHGRNVYRLWGNKCIEDAIPRILLDFPDVGDADHLETVNKIQSVIGGILYPDDEYCLVRNIIKYDY